MRSLLILILFAGTASADVGGGLLVQATRYDGQPNSNIGAAFEASLDRGRWQFLTELSIAGVSFGDDFFDGVAGTMYRGGLGTRYLARKFALGGVALELGFEGIVAMQDIEWRNGDRDVRPELDAGFTWNIHYPNKLIFRTSVRAFFTSSPTSAMACRGNCPPTDAVTSGYMIVTGLSW